MDILYSTLCNGFHFFDLLSVFTHQRERAKEKLEVITEIRAANASSMSALILELNHHESLKIPEKKSSELKVPGFSSAIVPR